jgi:hypothetical protein
MREDTASELLKNMETLEDLLLDKGYTPHERSFGGGGGFPKKEKDFTGETCPNDGGRLYKMTTKTGKTMVKCENSKYDFNTKTASGCDFVRFS